MSPSHGAREPAALAALPSFPRPAQRRRRVLVIEDNRDAAEMLQLLLECLGHEVEVARSGTEGVSRAVAWHPDIVLSDIGLPDLDGWGVARALRRDPNTSKTRLIAITGYSSDRDQERSRQAGFEIHLTKPCDPAVLERILA